MKMTLDNQEQELLAAVMQQFVIKTNTGQLGIVHGAERFISTSIVLKKPQLKVLDQIYAKLSTEDEVRRI